MNQIIKKNAAIMLIFVASSAQGQFDVYKAYEELSSVLKKHFTCSLFASGPELFAKLISNPQAQLKQELVSDLLACGANVNALPALADNPRQLTPLMTLLLHHGKNPEIADIVKILLAHGAEVNARALHGETSLYFAIRYSTPQVAEMLLAAGANPNIQLNYDLSTPLHAVFSKKGSLGEKAAFIKSLIAHAANPKISDKEGITPLHLVAKENLRFDGKDSSGYLTNLNDQLTIAKELLKGGAQVNAQNNSGETPLMFAAYYGADPNLVRFLLVNGADKTIKNVFNRTVKDFLREELGDPKYEELPHYADNIRALADIIS